ncbi:Uncharacterised protein [Mycobacteroides abscessus subsp. abscessus]|nr:Uncharacterised protein [Mycobacteroides abscessus subsp. abscessus]
MLTRLGVGIAEVEFGIGHLRARLGEGPPELPGVFGTVLGVLRRRPEDERVEERADAVGALRRRGHRVVDVPVGDLDGHVVGVGLGAGEHLVEHDADRVEVRAGIRPCPGDEFGGDVADGADERLRRRRRGDRAGEPEVGELDLTVGAEEDVVGFEVAVDDAGRVDGLEGGEDRVEDDDRLPRGEGAAVLELAPQGHRGQVLHDEVDDVAVAGLVVDGDEVGVGEATGVDRLATEALDEGVIGDEVLVHDLDRDLAVETQVGAPVDHRHAAAGDLRIDPVPVVEDDPDERVGQRIHRASSSRHRWSCTPRTKAFVSGSSPSARTDRRSW